MEDDGKKKQQQRQSASLPPCKHERFIYDLFYQSNQVLSFPQEIRLPRREHHVSEHREGRASRVAGRSRDALFAPVDRPVHLAGQWRRKSLHPKSRHQRQDQGDRREDFLRKRGASSRVAKVMWRRS